MLRLILFSLFIINVYGERKIETRTIELEGVGSVYGTKYWDGEFFEFFGIPYATAPTGRDKFKAPLPVTPWNDLRKANNISMCAQIFFEDDDDALYGSEDCLCLNVMIPRKASATNLVPIILYTHSGGFSGGSSSIAKYNYIAQQDVIVASFNYRVGGIGFACLGTEEIPGNAALKDIIAAMKFVKKHAKSMGGDPDNITLAGYSVGATLAELVALSKASKGLFNKLTLDSGSALAPYAINRDPINTARNIAISIGYEDTGDVDDLNEFLVTVNTTKLLAASRNYFLKNSTFGFAPCIEKPTNPDAVITESPLDTLERGDYDHFGLITGFSNMEGISRTYHFKNWSEDMSKNFADYLPADLVFKNNKERNALIKQLKQYYFKGMEINTESVNGYINYFSDSMFKYNIMKSAQLHAKNLARDMYMYEFTYVGKLNTPHQFADRLRGASHRDLTAYILDFYDWTRNYTDWDMRDRLTAIWGDYVKFEDPTPYESDLLTIKWPKYTSKDRSYLEIGRELIPKKDLFAEQFQFWDKIYKKYYWNPTVVNPDAHRLANKPKKPVTKPLESDSPAPEAKTIDDSAVNTPPKPVSSDKVEATSPDSKSSAKSPSSDTKKPAESKPIVKDISPPKPESAESTNSAEGVKK